MPICVGKAYSDASGAKRRKCSSPWEDDPDNHLGCRHPQTSYDISFLYMHVHSHCITFSPSDRGIQGTSCQSLLAILPPTWRSGKSAPGHSAAFLGFRNEDICSSKTMFGKGYWRFLSENRRIAFTNGHLRDWMSLLSGLPIKMKESYLYSRVDQSPRPFQRPRKYTASPTSRCCGVLCLPRPGWNQLSKWPSYAANAIVLSLSESLSGFASETAGAFPP